MYKLHNNVACTVKVKFSKLTTLDVLFYGYLGVQEKDCSFIKMSQSIMCIDKTEFELSNPADNPCVDCVHQRV